MMFGWACPKCNVAFAVQMHECPKCGDADNKYTVGILNDNDVDNNLSNDINNTTTQMEYINE